MPQHELYLDVQRLNFLHECRVKLDLIERGLRADPDGLRREALLGLIERHS